MTVLAPGPTVEQRSPRAGAVVFLAAVFIAVSTMMMPAGAAAQGRPGGSPTGPPQTGGSGGPGRGVGLSTDMNATGSVVVRVFDSHNMTLKQQAFVRLYSINSGVLLRGALTNLDGSVSFDNLPGVGWYAVDVSAAGYQTQRKQFQVNDTFTYTEVDVNLLPASGETTLTYMPASDLPGKARKHLDKGILAFRAGKLKQAQKELTDAYNAAPKSAVTNYLLGIFYLQTKDIPDAERYFTSAVSIDPKDVPALIGLAHVRYEKSDLKGSADALQKAIALDGKQWEALWLLAEIDLRQRDFQKAQKEAESAVEFGKGAANGAEFIEAAAFAELGETAQAVKMLQTFLRDAPSDRNAPVARQLAGRLEMELAAATTVAVAPAPAPAAQPTAASHPSVASNSSEALAVSLPKLPLPDWEPAGVDQERPPMADGVTCPAAQVIKEAGERVSELVDSVNRIEATERVTHEELSTLGHPISIEKRKFDYLISIEGSDSGLLMVDEDRQGGGGFLGHISMFGLADLPLIFHPSLRRDFQMTCEGLGKWEGRATWLVYFRQRPDRPEQIRSYQLLDGSSYTAGLKGRAWIAADTYQIVRIEADLMKAIPQIGLGSEEDVIEYAPVPFRSKNTVLWLPSSADIYYFYDHRPYHRHHTFTDYRLFSVSTSQKIGQPNTSEEKNNQP